MDRLAGMSGGSTRPQQCWMILRSWPGQRRRFTVLCCRTSATRRPSLHDHVCVVAVRAMRTPQYTYVAGLTSHPVAEHSCSPRLSAHISWTPIVFFSISSSDPILTPSCLCVQSPVGCRKSSKRSETAENVKRQQTKTPTNNTKTHNQHRERWIGRRRRRGSTCC